MACDANACAYKILYKAEEKKKRQSVQSKAGTDGGLAGPAAPSRQKKDLAFKETQGQDCHDSCDGDLRPQPLQRLCAKVPRGGALPPQTLRSPSAGPSPKYSQAPPLHAPLRPCCASVSRTVRGPRHRRVGVLHDANR